MLEVDDIVPSLLKAHKTRRKDSRVTAETLPSGFWEIMIIFADQISIPLNYFNKPLREQNSIWQ